MKRRLGNKPARDVPDSSPDALLEALKEIAVKGLGTAVEGEKSDFASNSMDGAAQVQVATADGATVLARYGLIGPRGILKTNVKPGETYRLICNGFGHHPVEVTPAKYPLILARTPEEWFAPPLQLAGEAAK